RLPLPDLVRPVADVPGEEDVSVVETAPNVEQLRAIEEPGVVFVSAGAGTGKTTVIVERFCRAVCERGLDVDSILVITYTERAAARLRLLASYGGRRLRRMLTGVHETLRSSGLPLRLEAPDDPHLDERLEELRGCAREAGAAELLSFLETPPGPEALLDLSDFRALDGVDDATRAVERAALEALAVRDRSELQELLLAYDRAYRAAKDRESALDFEDLQLLARELLGENDEIRERESWR